MQTGPNKRPWKKLRFVCSICFAFVVATDNTLARLSLWRGPHGAPVYMYSSSRTFCERTPPYFPSLSPFPTTLSFIFFFPSFPYLVFVAGAGPHDPGGVGAQVVSASALRPPRPARGRSGFAANTWIFPPRHEDQIYRGARGKREARAGRTGAGRVDKQYAPAPAAMLVATAWRYYKRIITWRITHS